MDLRLLTVSKSVFREARPVFFAENTITTHTETFTSRKINTATLELLRTVHVQLLLLSYAAFGDSTTAEWKLVIAFLKRYINLRELRITVATYPQVLRSLTLAGAMTLDQRVDDLLENLTSKKHITKVVFATREAPAGGVLRDKHFRSMETPAKRLEIEELMRSNGMTIAS